MLEISNLHRSFGPKQVLKGASFKLPLGAIAGLIGPSGGGKSVLLKIIGRVSEASQGEVRYPANDPVQPSLMFQEGALFDSLSVLDNVAFPLVSGRVPSFTLPEPIRLDVYKKVTEILSRVGLLKAINKMPGQLSGGMRRRVSLARALVSRPKILLLDDPTAGLDPVASSVILDLIVELHREYRPTTIIVSHDLRRLLPVVEKIFALLDGRIVFDGTLNELCNCQSHELTRFVSCRYDLKAA